MKFEELILKRESVRKFKDKEIENENIQKILEAGRVAPTAKNLQAFKIYVLNSEKSREIMDKASPCRYGAPVSLIICGDKETAWVNKREPYNSMEVDTAIVTTHMMLQAKDLGIDSIWVRYFTTSILREEFNIPENIIPIAVLNLGYRADDYIQNPLHTIRKPIDEIVEYVD